MTKSWMSIVCNRDWEIMAEEFDPYYKWLGIPASEQPPSHYRLLGLPELVEDADVIENAADQRMSHVKTFQSGKRSAHAQRLLNELSAARGTLLRPDAKRAYDEQLRGRIESTSEDPPAELKQSATSPAQPAFSVRTDSPTIRSRRKHAKQNQVMILSVIGLGVVGIGSIVATIIFIVGLPSDDSAPATESSTADSTTADQIQDPGSSRSDETTDVSNQTGGQGGGSTNGSTDSVETDRKYSIRINPRSFIELSDTQGLIRRDEPFTVELWIRCRPQRLITIIGDRAMGGQHPNVEQGSEKGWNLSMFPNGEGMPVLALSKGGLIFHDAVDFQWLHIAFCHDGNELKLYENGQLRTTRNDMWETSPTNIFVGDGPHCRRPNLALSSTILDISGLRISSNLRYDGDFDAPEIFELDEDTTVLLDFSKPDQNVIADLSGNGHHGTIVNTKWMDVEKDRIIQFNTNTGRPE